MTGSSSSADPITAHCSMSVEERWSDANVKACIKLWKFGPKEEARLREIQPLIADLGDYWKNDPYEVVGYLFDFKDWSTEKIVKLFREMVEWRQRENMDTFCQRYTPPPEMAYMPAMLLKDLDKDGDPIYMLRVGAWNIWDMYQRVGEDAFLEYSQFLQELVGTRYNAGVPDHWNWQTEYYEKQGPARRYNQFTNVFDMEGLSWAQHLKSPLFAVMGASSRKGQDYYAGSAKRIIILRAPRLFSMAWSMIKHFVDPQMQELIVFSDGKDYLKVWDKYIDRKAMPACMHPSGQGQPMPGFYEEFVKMEGGPIPKELPQKNFKKLSTMETSSIHSDDSLSLTGNTTDDNASTGSAPTKSVSLFKGRMDWNNRVVIDAPIKKSVSFAA